MTALFHDIIFGPVHSRRLGLSLGVNLLPLSSKLCSFDCIYCECGWNAEHPGGRRFNSREDVRTQLEATLRRMVADSTPPDVITFAGNGEPTMHPDFEAVIGDTIALRDALCPAAKVSVLSNATQIHRDSVRRALLRVDNNILKLDSAFDATVRRMNNPQSASYTVRGIVEAMKRFDGRMILQTMFLRGECGGQPVDNTTEEEVSAWLRLVAEIRPQQVMVYSLDRDTPCPTLEKVTKEELQAVAERVEALAVEARVHVAVEAHHVHGAGLTVVEHLVGDVGDAAFDGGVFVYLLAADQHRAGVLTVDAREMADERGFARAVRADKAVYRAVRH